MSGSKSNIEDKQINKEINSDVSFVSRWSRLKHENRQENDDAVVDAVVDKTAKQTIASDEEQQAPVKILTDADMPDIKSMTADSDYTDFLSPGVSEELRKLALRKLFRSEVFNIRDGLDEYDGDYTHFEKLGDIVTSDMKHQLELEAKRKAEQALQHESPEEIPLLSEDGISELKHDNDDSTDQNKIAADQQDIAQTSLDADTEKSAKIADENAELDEVEFDDRQTIITDKNKD